MKTTPEESPDIFAPPKKGPGGKRMNGWPVAIASVLFAVFAMVIFYTLDDRKHKEAQEQEAERDRRRGEGAAEAPIARPAGPDVDPVQIVQVASSMPTETGAPVVGLSESEIKYREKWLADRDAAMAAPARIENTGRRPQHSRQNVAMVPPPPPGTSGPILPHGSPEQAEGGEYGDINHQARKRKFLEGQGDGDATYLKHARMAPLFETQLSAGSIIPGVIDRGINSDLPGQIAGRVRQNVYDATRRHILIPAGAGLVGTYDSDVSAGQERVLVAWTQVIFPDGSTLFLDAMPGADKSGVAGMKDKVDNHYVRTFGQAILLSLFTAAGQLSQTRGSVSGSYSASQILAAQVGMQGFNLGSQLIRRNLNIQPTLEIRPGMEFTIAITKNIGLEIWRGHPSAQKTALGEVE